MIFSFIKQHKPHNLPFKRACKELKVSNSGYFKYLKLVQTDCGNLNKQKIIDAFKLHKSFYGYRKLFYYLIKQQEITVNLSKVRWVLHSQGLKSKTKKTFKSPHTSQATHPTFIANRIYKSEKTKVFRLNQVWLSDITYLPINNRTFVYLSLFLDAFSRKIVGWNLSSNLSSSSVLIALYKALKTRPVSKGLIIHSDRGVQYTSKIFRDQIKQLGFIQSMSRKGNCYDNASCESFFSLLKRELGNKIYSSMKEAKMEIFEWIEAWYNPLRLHSALGYQSPVDFEKNLDLIQNTSYS